MLPVVLCIDVEPDDHVFAPEQPSAWSGFEAVTSTVAPLRAMLEAATSRPAHFGWSLRADPQIKASYGSASYVADRYAPALAGFAAHGDAFGVHPHSWRWDPTRRLTVADHADQAWLDECAGLAVSSFRSGFGRAPDYHRFGAQYMSTHTMNLLRDLGVTVDMTVEPGEPPDRDAGLAGTAWTGTTGDFRRAPTEPYRPRPDDYLQPGPAGRLWELPLTSALTHHFPGPANSTRSRLAHPLRSARNLARRLAPAGAPDPGPAHRLLAMWLGWPSPARFWDAAFDAAGRLAQPYMAFAVRSDTECATLLERFMASLAGDDRATELCFATPSEALQMMGLMVA